MLGESSAESSVKSVCFFLLMFETLKNHHHHIMTLSQVNLVKYNELIYRGGGFMFLNINHYLGK